MELALNTAGLNLSITDQAVVAFATYEVGGEAHSGLWWFQQPVTKPAGQPPAMPGWLWPYPFILFLTQTKYCDKHGLILT